MDESDGSAKGIRLSKRGGRSVYVEHGIWYDEGTKHIHVTVPTEHKKAHWSYPKGHDRYELYKRILQRVGRWPEGFD